MDRRKSPEVSRAATPHSEPPIPAFPVASMPHRPNFRGSGPTGGLRQHCMGACSNGMFLGPTLHTDLSRGRRARSL